MMNFRTAFVMLGLIFAGWSGVVVAEVELRSRVLALFNEEGDARRECHVSGPHCTVRRALDSCAGARQSTDRGSVCQDAQTKYVACVAFVEDWRRRKAEALAQVDRESPGLGESYTEGVSNLRGLGQQRNSDQLWNDTIKALRNLDILNCPGFVTGTSLTPLEALAAWDQEDSKGLPAQEVPQDLEHSPEQEVAHKEAGGEAGSPADPAGEETGGATDPAGEETDDATDRSALAGTPSDGTTPDGQPAPGAVQPAMTSEGLDALVASCASLRHATLQASGLTLVHSPEADVGSCVKTRAEIPPNGGLFNECGVEVEVAYCLYRPYAGTHGTVVDCERGRYQVLRLPPYEGRSAFVTDAELVYTPACRVPGFSIVENGPFVPGYGLQMRCAAWPGAENPAAREGLFSGDCSNDHFARVSGLSIPPPVPAAAPAAEVWQPPEFSETPSESYDDSYDSSDSYDSYEDQGYSEPDTGQAITDAALQLMQMYIDSQSSQSSGSDGYDDYGAGEYEDEGDDSCGCSDGYCTCQ